MSLSVFAAARDAPGEPALVVDGRVRSYGELAEGARAAVAWLRTRDLTDARLIAVRGTLDPPTIEMVHALIALGVPALMLHPALGAEEQAALLSEASPAAIVDAGWRSDPIAAELDPYDPPPPPDDERALAILYTSGSTGRPKGVVLSRRAFIASARASAANLGWHPGDRWLLRLPIAHVGGLSILTRCLLARRAVVLAPAGDAAAIVEAIRRDGVTLLSLVPTLLARLLDRGAPPPPSLRALLLGGAPAAPSLLERAAAEGWPVLTTYGLTEACSQVTTQRPGTVNHGELGAGPPLPGIELRVDDDGAIHVRGDVLLSGYFPPHAHPPPLDADGWLTTGDRGWLDPHGNLHVAGRRTDRIITGGENVDPLEVEDALERQAGIRQACVFGVADEEWGEVVCAAVVGEEAEIPAALRAAGARLAAFKRPRRYAVLDALPLTASGKVDRPAAARLAAGRLRPLPSR